MRTSYVPRSHFQTLQKQNAYKMQGHTIKNERISGSVLRPIWLDCDPGHDDALAILLAGYHPQSKLLGISTVHGNQTLNKVTENAFKITHVAGLDEIAIYEGQSRPLMRHPRVAEAIHGESGMDVLDCLNFSIEELNGNGYSNKRSQKAVFAMNEMISNSFQKDPHTPVNLVCTGPLTNAALFLTLFPEWIPHIRVVCMGGTLGIGNIGPVVEFNFAVDPEAAHIVFSSGVDLTMIPLEVTHDVLATKAILSRIERIQTPFRSYVIALLRFFAKTYKDVFIFDDPPVHDPCAVLCALEPDLFELEAHRVDIEVCSTLSAGQSVCDIWKQSDLPPNCHVAIDEADLRSPLRDRSMQL